MRMRLNVDLSLFRNAKEKERCLEKCATSSYRCSEFEGIGTVLIICLRWYKNSSCLGWSLRIALADMAMPFSLFPLIGAFVPDYRTTPAPFSWGSRRLGIQVLLYRWARNPEGGSGSKKWGLVGRDRVELIANCPTLAKWLIICLLDPFFIQINHIITQIHFNLTQREDQEKSKGSTSQERKRRVNHYDVCWFINIVYGDYMFCVILKSSDFYTFSNPQCQSKTNYRLGQSPCTSLQFSSSTPTLKSNWSSASSGRSHLPSWSSAHRPIT